MESPEFQAPDLEGTGADGRRGDVARLDVGLLHDGQALVGAEVREQVGCWGGSVKTTVSSSGAVTSVSGAKRQPLLVDQRPKL